MPWISLFPTVKTAALYLVPIKSYSKNTHGSSILKWILVWLWWQRIIDDSQEGNRSKTTMHHFFVCFLSFNIYGTNKKIFFYASNVEIGENRYKVWVFELCKKKGTTRFSFSFSFLSTKLKRNHVYSITQLIWCSKSDASVRFLLDKSSFNDEMTDDAKSKWMYHHWMNSSKLRYL